MQEKKFSCIFYANMAKKKTKKRIILACFTALILLLVLNIIFFAGMHYKADSTALAVLNGSELTSDEKLESTDKWYVLTPAGYNSQSDKTVIILYPGANIDSTSYLPLMSKLQDFGYICFISRPILHLAVLDFNAAQKIMDAYPEIDSWFIAGHSLGGSSAALFSEKHMEETAGLIHLGSFEYGSYPADDTIVIYGSEDKILSKKRLNGEAEEYIISGGNHSQFGNYGNQLFDGQPSITTEEQQEQTAGLIDSFIRKQKEK